MNRQKPHKPPFSNFIRYSSLGFEMMAIIGFGTWAGFKIDNWVKSEFRIFTLGFMVFSVIIATLYGVRNLLKK